jgi:hypothetical protein
MLIRSQLSTQSNYRRAVSFAILAILFTSYTIGCSDVIFKSSLVRCPLDPNATDALRPGDLDRMFERIISAPSLSSQFNITIRSRPYLEGAEGIY